MGKPDDETAEDLPVACVLRDGVLVEAARCGGCGEVFATVAALDAHRKTCRRPGMDEAKVFNTRPFPGTSSTR